jgi:4'-phosphopantetheinyl transferase
VEHLVKDHALFPWRGIDAAPPGEKPRFTGAPDADFSISHSGRAVLVAVAEGRGVGVDVEAAPFRAFDSSALRARMCSDPELRRLREVQPDAQPATLAAWWTAKEAAVKASGRGLAEDFRTFEIIPAPSPADGPVAAHLAVTDGVTTHLAALDVAASPAAAAASARSDPALVSTTHPTP